MDICLESPNGHDFDSAEDSCVEDFGGILFISLIVYFRGCS